MIQGPLYHWGTSFAHKFNLKDYPCVLDVGCREGSITTSVAKHYPQHQFIAIDNVATSLEIAHSHPWGNIHFELGDALNLKFENQFDAIISFNCLLWVKEKRQAFQQIYNALKPGGKACLQLFVIHGRLKNDRFLYQTANQPKWQPYFKDFAVDYHEITLGECSQLLHQTGFIIHRLEFARYDSIFDDAQHLKEWMSRWASHPRALPKAKRCHFMYDAIDAYLDYHHHSKDSPFTYHEHLLEIVCEKPFQEIQTAPTQYRFGELQFTPKEAFVLKHSLQGRSAKEIALLACLSAKTIEFHLSNIKEKLNLHKRSDLYQAALNHGFISLIFDTKL